MSDDFRVAGLKFDNAQFEAAVRKTLNTLLELNKGLKLDGATKGLDNVSKSASKFSMEHMGQQIDGIAKKFSALSVVAIASLATIASKVASTAAQAVKGFTTSPITDGLKEYETQLNSIQTILANTGLEGAKGLAQVNNALNDLNTYSDKTIYNFTEMARNIGTFTAAGIDLKTSTEAIKGIANLAAISGSSAEQASTAMYQLSQALAAGKVSLVDWNSVVNAGMGGKVFQQSLVETAKVHGVAVDQIIKDEGSFRDSLQSGWLTSDILTETLQKFTGDLNASQLKTMGYTDAQIKGILKMGKTAQDAATKVKTFSQLISTLQEAAGSGWAKTWSLIFGNFDEARTLFTGASNVLGGFITASANARNKILSDWKALGGRTVAIDAIKNAFKALISILKPIKDAFREIFPAKTGKDLYDLTVTIRNFTKGLIIGSETADKLKRTFAGVFAIFSIGLTIVKDLLGVFFNLFQTASSGSGSFLDITASVGDFLVKLDDAIKNGEGFRKFLVGLNKVLTFPIKAFKFLASAIGDFFGSLDASDSLSRVSQRLEPFGRIGEVIGRIWERTGQILKNIFTSLEPLVGKLTGLFGGFGTSLSDALGKGDFSTFLDAVNTGLFGALVLMFRKFLKGGLGGIGGGFFSKITEPFEQLTGVLKAMQTQIKANTLLKIAGAVALLTASVIGLSLIDSAKLTKALTALTIMFAQLAASLAIFSKATAGFGFAKLATVGLTLIALAAAIDILVLAVLALSQLSWSELAKGLVGVAALLASVAAATKLINPAQTIAAGASILLLAAGIKVLASAVTDLSGLDWGEMAKGIVGVAALLGALALFTKFAAANAGGISSGAGLLLLATGIKVLASALSDIASMSWAELAKGLVGMAAGLTAISLALILIPPSSLFSAAAILTASAAMLILNQALQAFASMSWEEIAKALVVLAGSLTIIGLAMAGMVEALPGAAALLVVAGSLAILTPVLLALGGMGWVEIAKGLVALAGALTVIGLAGLLLTPLIPSLLGLGAAIALLGIGLGAAGAGLLAFSLALTALAAAGTAGAAAIIGFVTTLLKSVPVLVGLVGDIVVSFANMIKRTAPAVASAAVALITSLLNAIVAVSPRIINAIGTLMVNWLNGLLRYVPRMVSAGIALVTAILNGVASRAPALVAAAVNLIVSFLNAISAQQGRVIDAGVKLIISFVNGVANAIRANTGAMRSAGLNLATAIIDGMTGGLASGIGRVVSAARNIAGSAISAAKGMLGINSPSKEFIKIGQSVNEGFAKGLSTPNNQTIHVAYRNMEKSLTDLMNKSTLKARALGKELAKIPRGTAKYNQVLSQLRQVQHEYNLARSARGNLIHYLNDEGMKLHSLATKYGQLGAKIAATRKTVEELTKTRDDYKKQLIDQFDNLPDIGSDTKLADYMQTLQDQVVKTKVFTTAIDRLSKLGLNKDTLKEILDKGTDALPFASQLLDAGKEGINQINALDKQLVAAANNMGHYGAMDMYQAGIDAANGLVKGLASQQKAIQVQMNSIAAYMAASIKKSLGIRSPSKVFAEIGEWTVQGLVKGLDKTTDTVAKSAENVGVTAATALRKAIQEAGSAVDANMDLQPRIRPVLDLSEIKKNAGKIGDHMPPIDLSAAYAHAKSARFLFDANRQPATTDEASAVKNELNYTQNNYSPKTLSRAEIYRQTKNQLSTVKGALSA